MTDEHFLVKCYRCSEGHYDMRHLSEMTKEQLEEINHKCCFEGKVYFTNEYGYTGRSWTKCKCVCHNFGVEIKR